MKKRKFPLTRDGYKEARSFLKGIGKWEEVTTTGFSVDGYTITDVGNYYYEKREGAAL